MRRRRLSDEGAEAGLRRKQRQDRRKQQVSPRMHDGWHQAPMSLDTPPGLSVELSEALICYQWLPIV